YDLPRSAQEDAAFAAALERFPAPLLAQHFVGRQGLSGAEAVQINDENAERPAEPLPLLESLARNAADRGLINQLPDPDGTIRTMPLAFLPAETDTFLPTLGFAAWIQAGLTAASPDQALAASGLPDPVTASDAARAAFRRLWEAAPHPFPGFGHEGLDAIVRRREARMLVRHLATQPGISPATTRAWRDIAEKIDTTGLADRGWLPFPGGRPPLTGPRHLPCLRIPFTKPSGSLKGDGIPVISMGVLLASAPPDSLGSIDIGEMPAGTRFAWGATGTASISGIATDLYGRPLAGIGVMARQTDGAAWASATTGADGRFTVGALPAGSYRTTLTRSRPPLTVRLSTAEPLLIGTGPRELSPARFPPTDSTLGGTLSPATQPLQLVIDGEALPVGMTDATGRLPLDSIPDNTSIAVVEGEEVPNWAPGSSPVVMFAGNPLSGRKTALLEPEGAWNARFTARIDIPAGAASFTATALPSSLDTRVLLLGDAEADGEPHTAATELLLDTTTLLPAVPPVTPARLHTVSLDQAGVAGNDVPEAWLVGDDGVWHGLRKTSTKLELPPGRYLLLGRDAQGRTGRADRIATTIAGRTLFFGTTLLEDQDFVTTPINLLETRFRKLPGVHLHANLCSALCRGAFLRPTPFHPDAAPDAWPLLNLLLLIPFLAAADHLFQGGRGISAVAVLGLTIIAWLAASAGLFARNILFPAAFPVSLTVLFGVARGAQAYFAARTRERETRATFGRFIAAPMVEQILRHPDTVRPGGEKKELTVMFTDLAGFTSISEMMTPEELTKLMNEYLGEMTRVLFEYGGTLDKYIGDALMGFWNHP
ncbi:MAG TPA: adenylate/guanylate cyclase domain-containing protein, partial [Candidatus Ozemobacteraceae bacterium]